MDRSGCNDRRVRVRVEGFISEGLGGGSFDDLPDVDAHAVGCDFEFVDETDVDGAVDILEQFDKFRNLGERKRGRLVRQRLRREPGRPRHRREWFLP